MCTTSIYEARNNFSEYVKMAENGETIELTRYNKPVAYIVCAEEYEEYQAERPSLIQRLAVLKQQFADVVSEEGFPLPPKVYPDPNRKIFED